MKKVLLYLFVILQIVCIAQTPQLDSLKLELKKAEHDTTRCNILNAMIEAESDNAVWPKYNEQLKSIAQTNLKGLSSDRPEYKVFRNCLATAIGNIGYVLREQGNWSKASEKFKESLKMHQENGSKEGMANSLNNIGVICEGQGEVSEALKYLGKSLEIHQELGNREAVASILNNIGYIYQNLGDIPKALEYYSKGLIIEEEIGKKEGIAISLNNIGVIYQSQGQFNKALECFNKCLKIMGKSLNNEQIAISLNNIAQIYQDQGDLETALEYLNKSLKIEQENGYKDGLAITLNMLGTIYFTKGELTKALLNYEESLSNKEEIGDKAGIATTLNNLSIVYLRQKNYQKALNFASRSLRLSKDLGYPESIRNAADKLYQIYKATGNHKLALENYELYIQMRDSLNNIETQKATIKQQTQYEFDKKKALADKEHELQLKQQEEQAAVEKAKQNIIIASVSLVLLLVAVFSGFLYNRFKVTQKQKAIIEQKEKETHEQKLLIEEKHKEITDSINYAERIQRSFLATKELLDENLNVGSRYDAQRGSAFTRTDKSGTVTSSLSPETSAKGGLDTSLVPRDTLPDTKSFVTSSADKGGVSRSDNDYFILFKPKDVVSGDFYWSATLNNGHFALATADSTGHGVPGAIMSLLNITSLEKAIETETSPDKILNLTRNIIIERLKKDGSIDGGKDGMDCSLIVFNENRTRLQIAAANNPVWIMRSSSLREVPTPKGSGTTKQSGLSNEEIASLPTYARNDEEVIEIQTDLSTVTDVNEGLDTSLVPRDTRPDMKGFVTSSADEGGVSRSEAEVIEIKADKMPVGKHDKQDVPFTIQELELQAGDVIYTLTDGFPDQFGGERGKKFMAKKLRELLQSICHLPMPQQQEILSKTFSDWVGDLEQVDDVTLIGIRV